MNNNNIIKYFLNLIILVFKNFSHIQFFILKMSQFNSNLESVYKISQLFYDKYIQKFEIGMNPKIFNKFRLYYHNIITEVN